jgi:hypothetical protein
VGNTVGVRVPPRARRDAAVAAACLFSVLEVLPRFCHGRPSIAPDPLVRIGLALPRLVDLIRKLAHVTCGDVHLGHRLVDPLVAHRPSRSQCLHFTVGLRRREARVWNHGLRCLFLSIGVTKHCDHLATGRDGLVGP